MYPAISVLQALKNERVDVLWVGGEGGMEADLVRREGIAYQAIPAAGVHGVGFWRLPGNILALGRGVLAARRILQAYRPDVLFFTGGYVAFPVAVAGRSIPSLVYVPDIEPGLAIKSIARYASRIAVTAEESRQYFSEPQKVVVTGYPVRRSLLDWTRETARERLNLDPEQPVLLFFGGSKGARSINRAVLHHIDGLLTLGQVVHITGRLDWEHVNEERDRLPADFRERYHIYPYLHEEMGAALHAADLVVARAGASTLGEFPLVGVPAILVPYPHAWRYQKVNADYLTRNGAAILLEDADLWGKLLLTVQALMESPARLKAMREAMRSLAKPEAAESLGQLLLALGKEGKAL